MKYMILIHTSAEGDKAIRGEALADFEAAHGSVIDELSTSGELIETHELAVEGAKVVRTDGGLSVTDGPYAETTEWVGGYYVVDVADESRAVEIAARFVEARYAAVEVRAIL